LKDLKIALLQMAASGSDQQANLRKGEEFCRRARRQGADIALFPEMWNIGYTASDPRVWSHDHDPLDLDALRDYRRREAWGNAYRKPRAYGLLTSPAAVWPSRSCERTREDRQVHGGRQPGPP
jgi:hypothetical protein